MIEEIEDQFHEIRRLGSLPHFPPVDTPLKAFASEFNVWTMDECRKAIAAKKWRSADVFPGEGTEDQGQFGSCNGWALANAAWRAAYAGGNTKLTRRSGPYVYSLINHGVDNGSALIDGFNEGQQYGIPSYASCGQNKIYRAETRQYDSEAADFQVVAPLLIKSWDELWTAAAGPFFLVIAVQVGRNFERMNGDVIGIDDGAGNHAVCQSDARVTDVGDIELKIIMDWGLRHGVNGCGWLGKRHLATTINYHQFYAVPFGQTGTGEIA